MHDEYVSDASTTVEPRAAYGRPMDAAPSGDADLAAVGALVADPGRCRILLALDDGRALPASTLAAEAGVTRGHRQQPPAQTHHRRAPGRRDPRPLPLLPPRRAHRRPAHRNPRHAVPGRADPLPAPGHPSCGTAPRPHLLRPPRRAARCGTHGRLPRPRLDDRRRRHLPRRHRRPRPACPHRATTSTTPSPRADVTSSTSSASTSRPAGEPSATASTGPSNATTSPVASAAACSAASRTSGGSGRPAATARSRSPPPAATG